MSLPTKTPPNIPFDKNKNKSVRTASEITTIRKFQADSAYYYDNSETQAKDLASIYGSTIYPRHLSQSGLTLDAGRLLNTVETPLQPSSDGRILYSDILTPDAPGYDIMVMAGQSNGVGDNNYAIGIPTTAQPTVSGGGFTVTYPLSSSTGVVTIGTKALVTGYTVSGTGYIGTGFVNIFVANSSVTIAFPFTSSGTVTNTTSTARIQFLDFDDQLFLTATKPIISGSNTIYTYDDYVGTLPSIDSTVTVQNLSVLGTSSGFNGTGRVVNIDTGAKTITVDIKSSTVGITTAFYNNTTGATSYTMPNNFTVNTSVTVSGITVSSGSASVFNITGLVVSRNDAGFIINQNPGSGTTNTYFSGGTTTPTPAPTPVTTGIKPSRIVVISRSDVSSKVFTLVGTNNSVLRAYDPLPQNNLDLFSGNGIPIGRGSLVTLGCNYAISQYLRPDRRVLLVQTSDSGKAFRNLDNSGTGWWQSTSPFVGGAAYTNCVKRIQSAMTQTFGTSLPRNNRIVAVCWQEGETDITFSTSAQYKSNLLNFVGNLRTAVSIFSTNTFGLTSGESEVMANTFSFLVGAMSRNSDSAGPHIRDAGQDVAGTAIAGTDGTRNAVPRAAYVPRPLIGIDDHGADTHYSGTDQKILGDQYYTGLNSVVTAYSGISTVTSATVKRFTSRRVSTLTTNWVLTTPSDVKVDIYISGTASSKYGFLLDSGTLSSGTTSAISIYKPIDNVYYYAVITPKTATLNGVPFTTSAVLSVPVDDVAPTVASPSISIQSQKLVATWSTSKPCASLVEFFSNSTNSTSGGTFVSGVTVLPNTLTATIPNALVSRSFYYAVVTPAGGSPVTSGTVQQPITPILETRFSTALTVVGSIAPVDSTTITGSVAGTTNLIAVTAGVARIGQRLSGILSSAGSRPVYILCSPATAPAAAYSAILSESISTVTSRSISLIGCGLLTVTSGTPVAGALLTSTSPAFVGGTRIVGPTPDPNVWVVSQSQTVEAGTTFVFSGPVDTSIIKKQFMLVHAEGSQPPTFPTDLIMNSVVYNSPSRGVTGVSPVIGVNGGFPGGSFTKSVWVLLSSITDTGITLFGYPGAPLFIPDKHIRSFVGGDGGTAATRPITNNLWTHIAATYDASSNVGNVYVNGIRDPAADFTYKDLTDALGTNPFVGSGDVKYSYSNFAIGGSNAIIGSAPAFRGRMDDIRLYPIALTDAEILSVYNSKVTVTNLQTTAATENSVSLSWTGPSGASEYRIQQSIDEGATWVDSTPPSTLNRSVMVTGLSPTNSRIAFKVAAVVGGIVGMSTVINTSTLARPIFQLVGRDGNPVADIINNRQITATPTTASLSSNEATGIAGVTRNVIRVSTAGGYVSVAGDMPAGSNSFCCWYKLTSGDGSTLFHYSTNRTSTAGASLDANSIYVGNYELSGTKFGYGVAAGSQITTRGHNLITTRVLDGGIIECDRNHGFTNNAAVIFSSDYLGPSPSGNGAAFTTFITGFYTRYFIRTTGLAENQFVLRASSSGDDLTPTPRAGAFVSGVTLSNNSAATNNIWIHMAAVFDQITSTTTFYLSPSVGASLPTGTAPKTLVPRPCYRSDGDRLVFGNGVSGTSAADLFQIGRFSSFPGNFAGYVDDFRAYAKVLSPYEISEIVAGRA